MSDESQGRLVWVVPINDRFAMILKEWRRDLNLCAILNKLLAIDCEV